MLITDAPLIERMVNHSGQSLRHHTMSRPREAPGDSSIHILIHCFSKTIDWEGWLRVKQGVIFRCCAMVETNGLSIAFPSRTLYLRQDDGHAEDTVASNA